VQELYERLVESERQRAQDLREIAMALASGKKGKLCLTASWRPTLPAVDTARFPKLFESTFHITVCVLQTMW
jgi:hypothetical protein